MAAATILKKKNRDISAMVWPIFMKFGMMTKNVSFNKPRRPLKNLNFTNPRWRSAVILKTAKSPYLCNRLTDFDEIWHGDADCPFTADRPLKF